MYRGKEILLLVEVPHVAPRRRTAPADRRGRSGVLPKTKGARPSVARRCAPHSELSLSLFSPKTPPTPPPSGHAPRFHGRRCFSSRSWQPTSPPSDAALSPCAAHTSPAAGRWNTHATEVVVAVPTHRRLPLPQSPLPDWPASAAVAVPKALGLATAAEVRCGLLLLPLRNGHRLSLSATGAALLAAPAVAPAAPPSAASHSPTRRRSMPPRGHQRSRLG